jgi:tRNA G18 (ribose-2'-O)-methylase SpoU
MIRITLLLHNIRSTHNVGSIFRTGEGFGVEKIICSGYTPYPTIDDDPRLPHVAAKLESQIHKTALGAEHMVPFTHYDSLEEWLSLNERQASPLPIYALEQAASAVNIHDVSPRDDFALLIGEEVKGITPKYLERCEQIFEIPMSGRKESFNVSVAAGIALYALSTH